METGIVTGWDIKGVTPDNLLKLKEDQAGLEKAAENFESVFINMLLKEMKNSVPDDEGILPVSSERKLFEEMFYEEMANHLSAKRSFGVAKAVIDTYKSHVQPNMSSNLSKGVQA